MKKRLQTRQDRIMTFANFISFSRIVLAFPLIYSFERMRAPDGSIVDYHYWLSLIILLVIVLSDFLDGFVARMADEITDFGKLIDPIADKICMVVVIIYLISIGGPVGWAYLVFLFLLTIRDTFIVTIGIYLMYAQDEVFASNTSGKWFLALSGISMLLFIFYPDSVLNWLCYGLAMVLFVVSSYEYIRRYLKYFRKIEGSR